MSRPVVAVTSYDAQAQWAEWDQRAALTPMSYLNKVREAGGQPVILPPDSLDSDALARMDGLVLVGGPDVDAARYGQQRHASTDVPGPRRDDCETEAYWRARELGLPVLGICRGLQVMAVAHGGTLVQDIPGLGLGIDHDLGPGTYSRHQATFVPDSAIARAMGGVEAEVMSSHHQCVDEAGTLTVTGWAEDGTIEVCEDPSARFVVGVQWHPEVHESNELCEAFISACRSR